VANAHLRIHLRVMTPDAPVHTVVERQPTISKEQPV
jgi:hypothetical protein